MAQLKVRLDEAMETALITLYLHALDAKLKRSALGDTMAVSAIEKIDYDFAKLKVSSRIAPNAAARAKHFDGWTREFLAGHDQSTVLHLGAGLDPRVFRVDPGPGVEWYDVDFPDVIEIREKIFPQREHYRMIGSSVTDFGWLERIPADRPTFVVAEGLTMYLHPEEGHELFRRITDRFPAGEVTFDTHNSLAVRMVNKRLARTTGATPLHWAINDPHELERQNPKLRLRDVVGSFNAPSAVALGRSVRLFGMLVKPFPALRNLDQYLRFQYGG